MWYIPLYYTTHTTKSLHNNNLHTEKVCTFAPEINAGDSLTDPLRLRSKVGGKR